MKEEKLSAEERGGEGEMLRVAMALSWIQKAGKGVKLQERTWHDKRGEAGRLILSVISTTLNPSAAGTFPGFPGNTNNQETDLFFRFLRLYEAAITMTVSHVAVNIN